MADTSPLIALERIGQLDLLAMLFDQIVIPPAVHAEFEPRSLVFSSEFPDWLKVQQIVQAESVRHLSTFLHPGEAEAIVLAGELAAPLIIDEKRGRIAARRLGIEVTGTLALLLAAKNAGLIEQVAPILDQLLAVGFHLGANLRSAALRNAGEH